MHVTAVISSVKMANGLIKDGIQICEIRIRPEKLHKEPIQCLQCRCWGHFAANCLELEDTCGTCGEAHRTSICKNPNKRHYVFCNMDMHASWDRNCLEFIRQGKIFDERHPENNMIYFPTNEDWMLTSKPNRRPIEERFPQHYAVNNLPTMNTNKRMNTKGKKPMLTKPIASKDMQGKE